MTQPPQPPPPPNEPPQGGFGAPQDPPPGGFGAPQQPPAYGYPQAPPPRGPGYGYPQAPQPGYGYPQQPPQQQPGYGYPAAPPPPTPPGGGSGGGGKKINAQMMIIIAAAVAVALIIVGGVWYASGKDDNSSGKDESKGTSGSTEGGKDGKGRDSPAFGGEGKEKAPADPKSTVAFQVPHPKVTDLTTVEGSWVTDTVYAKSGVSQVVGYDPVKGTQKWVIPLPGNVCAATKHVTQDNKTAIAFEAAKRTAAEKYQRCTEVGVIDLNAGELLWSKSTKGANGGDQKVDFKEVTIGGPTVAAGGTSGGAAWNLADGAPRWVPKIDPEDCYDMGYAGGEALATVRKCGPYENRYLVVQALDPATGAPLSSYKMSAGIEWASIVSSKPLVVAADVGDSAGDGSGISDFFSIDEKTGKLRSKITVDADRYAAQCASTEVESCQKVVVGNGRIYVPTEEHEGAGEYSRTNEIVSFDLTTGKATTDRADAGDRYTMSPLRMDGGNIIAYKSPPYDEGGQIVSIDGRALKQTVLMENPGDKAVRSAETSFSLNHAELRYANGRMYLSEILISKPTDSTQKDYLVVAFGTG
ncbi:PQQ-binding-like beta-propeller repeat protein [Streptomyces sp. A3M-1-3]|uniref:outer membrane protein assembly factor BamB family protein n=1 Tax=Streptomyces sp. A3M-1-3 TaxID=2962044 RepID=UPI0020B8C43E|nr:PQQ-binding-like beta-propeller repeat protein [Streptomyces sp. A3M-1-3]MCP3820446.1 PQQ-binding-like beta-propeller repeat protein [Streptomyces sp. A3M-1-3]